VILEGVERQVGGTGAAAGQGLEGAFDSLGEELRQFGANLGQRIAESLQLAAALRGIAGGIAAVNAQLFAAPLTIEGVGASIAQLRAEREELRRELATATERLSANPAMPGLPLSLAEQFTPDPGASDATGMRARFDQLTREIEQQSQVWVRLRNEQVAIDRKFAESQAELAAEAEEAARRIAEAGRVSTETAAAVGGAMRAETAAARAVLDAIRMEIDLLRESDPVKREMIALRVLLADATARDRAEIEAAIATRIREQLQLEQGRQMWDMLGRSALDALDGIAPSIAPAGRARSKPTPSSKPSCAPGSMPWASPSSPKPSPRPSLRSGAAPPLRFTAGGSAPAFAPPAEARRHDGAAAPRPAPRKPAHGRPAAAPRACRPLRRSHRPRADHAAPASPRRR
jgi:hypothetical protein